MTAKKGAAVGVASPAAARTKEIVTADSIAESAGNVKEAAWREAEQRKAREENLRMWSQMKTGLLHKLPAESGGVEYQAVTAIIYRVEQNKNQQWERQLQVELLDKCGHSTTDAAPRQVSVLGVEQYPEEAPEPEWFAELVEPLKVALFRRLPVVCRWESCSRVTAIYFRRSVHGGYRVQIELAESGTDRRIPYSPKTVKIVDDDTSAAACWIDTEESE